MALYRKVRPVHFVLLAFLALVFVVFLSLSQQVNVASTSSTSSALSPSLPTHSSQQPVVIIPEITTAPHPDTDIHKHDHHDDSNNSPQTLPKPPILEPEVPVPSFNDDGSGKVFQAPFGIDVRLRQYHFRVGPGYDPSHADFHKASPLVNCTVLPPGEPRSEISAKWCLSRDGCAGEFEFRRSGTCVSKPPVRDEETAQYYSQTPEYGPDSYRLRLVGTTEIVLPSFSHHGGCVYSATYMLTANGGYHLEGELWYKNYNQYNEFTQDATPMARTPLFIRSEKKVKGVIEGAEHHDPQYNLYHYNHPTLGKLIQKGKFRASKLFVWDQFTPASQQLRAQCVRSQSFQPPANTITVRCSPLRPVKGRWVGLPGSAPKLSPEMSHVHFERAFPLKLYRFVPTGCYWEGYTQHDLGTKCLGNKKLAFLGDSHNRVTFVHLLNVLNRPKPMQDHGVKQMGTRRETISTFGISMDFYNDVLLENIGRLVTSSSSYDVVIAGMGSWAIGGQGKDAPAGTPSDFGRWSRVKYRSVIKGIMEHMHTVRQHKKGNVKLVWIGIPAYPPNQRTFAKLKGEYRNNPRIQAYNAVAYKIAEQC
eukprot:PhF_6_TR676/c0_g1_i1/m.1035